MADPPRPIKRFYSSAFGIPTSPPFGIGAWGAPAFARGPWWPGPGGATRPRPYPACMRWPGNYIKKKLRARAYYTILD